MRLHALAALSVLAVVASCSAKKKTPELATRDCFQGLAKGDFESASKFFPNPQADLKWAKSYYQGQDLPAIFGITVNDTVMHDDKAIVTYTPGKTLLYNFDGRSMALLTRMDGAWHVDLRESLELMSNLGSSGKIVDLILLKALVDKSTVKLGKAPATVQKALEAEEDASLRKRKASWAEGYECFQEGATRGGESAVMFYARQAVDPGLYLGISKTRCFVSDGTRPF